MSDGKWRPFYNYDGPIEPENDDAYDGWFVEIVKEDDAGYSLQVNAVGRDNCIRAVDDALSHLNASADQAAEIERLRARFGDEACDLPECNYDGCAWTRDHCPYVQGPYTRLCRFNDQEDGKPCKQWVSR